MVKIIAPSKFSSEIIAEAFPGALTFRGTPSEMDGYTEIEGDVDEQELLKLINKEIKKVDKGQALAYIFASPLVATKSREKIPWVPFTLGGAVATVIYVLIQVLQ